MSSFIEKSLIDAATCLNDANMIVVLSGAGLSQASGIPTYRDKEGLWENSINLQYSTIESYGKNPKEFLSFWDVSLKKILKTSPNPAHISLYHLQKLKKNTKLITQNVDGLLQKAGCSDVIELHGNLKRLKCDTCGLTSEYRLEKCLRCGNTMRPAVVLFGELLDEITLQRAQEAASCADTILIVGTRAEVYPAASIPLIALQNNATIIVLDTESTEISAIADVMLKGKAEELLPKLIKLL